MDKASADEKKRKAATLESRKRPASSSNEPTDNKRIKLETEVAPQPTPNPSAAFLSAFDFTSLPAALITNLIVANLEAFTEPQLIALVNTYRQNHGLNSLQPTTAPSVATPPTTTPAIPTGPRKRVYSVEKSLTPTPQTQLPPVIKNEPVDPLQMDIDEEELEYEPEKLNEVVISNALDINEVLFSFLLLFSCRAPLSDPKTILHLVAQLPTSPTSHFSSSTYLHRKIYQKVIVNISSMGQYHGFGTVQRNCVRWVRASLQNRRRPEETRRLRCGCCFYCG
jgi:symplekin